MKNTVLIKTYKEIPFCEKEILRYALCKKSDDEIKKLLDFSIKEAEERLSYKVCYIILPLKIKEDVCDFGVFTLKSKDLAKNLDGSLRAIVFSATVGILLDRMISSYARISPSKALMLDALGSERIESLCDAFCSDLEKENGFFLKPRFSPGYGDLPLSSQRELFRVLNPEKNIGLFLSDTMMMSPLKSVSAIAGITDKEIQKKEEKCALCDKKDCAFRGGI